MISVGRILFIILLTSLEVESDVAVFEMKQEIVTLQAQIEDGESEANILKAFKTNLSHQTMASSSRK